MTGPVGGAPIGPGRLVLVVGPSGAGKDTLIRAARDRFGSDPRFAFPRRTITRPASAAEDNHSCDPVTFAGIVAAGGFAASWTAHGQSYGIPASVGLAIAEGRTVVCNVSRTVIGELRRRYADVLVIEVTAPAAVLSERLSARGRPEDGDLDRRIGRSAEMRDVHPDVRIVNATSRDAAVSAFIVAVGEPGAGSGRARAQRLESTPEEPPMNAHFLVDRSDLGRFAWSDLDASEAGEPRPGAAVVAIDRFALTANNITYARTGHTLGYWRYFPAPAPWGRIPVWGIATVLRSRAPGLSEGERVYGFLPISRTLQVEPSDTSPVRFLDGAPHRTDLPRTYNEYIRVDRDQDYDATMADLHLVLRPLFSLAFFLSAHLIESGFFGARHVVLSSASSKTALGLAFLIRRHAPEIDIVGLTGDAKVGSVQAMNHYDRVLSYGGLAELSPDSPSVFVDMAGDAVIRAAFHERLGPSLKASIGVGFTHGIAPAASGALPGPPPEFFFTPTHILQRREAWGAAELRRRLSEAWAAFLVDISPRLTVATSTGPEALQRVYLEVLEGRSPPDRAHIISLSQERSGASPS